ncbi:hypothetical protein A1O7_02825 [Cladophialophora yegresii CBS 114405]|uniref:Uncharacterized protein n=1 Tax=Cladophialophora yegresii CBS 114405 TaxID=1182544 RepID=W9WCW5_9EURO|nr:uncharacterized protein A1O7_02825 [Cladophialophora yegresii CBS 114405]EXJ62391.1 hypothetical protein A1O7_02825 [Cladophialophora yegresii CBS 114405]
MANRIQLQYELAQIELEKRQLRLEERQLELERKELVVKHQLEQLITIDLTENSAQVKSESHDASTEDPQLTICNTLSAAPAGDHRADLTMTSAPGHEDETMVAEKSDRPVLASRILAATATGELSMFNRDFKSKPEKEADHKQPRCPSPVPAPNSPSSLTPISQLADTFQKEAGHGQQRCPSPAPALTPLSAHTPISQLADTPTDDRNLLAKFLAKPGPKMPKPQAGIKRRRIESDEEKPTSREPGKKQRNKKVISESDDETSTSRGSAYGLGKTKTKLERTCKRSITRGSRAQVVKEQDSRANSRLTETEQRDLISSYTNLFLRHMQTIEQGLRSKDGKGKPEISSRMHKLNVGRTHTSVTLLHREFERVVNDHAKSHSRRSSLQAELKKFENALPYWSPKCKALPKQKERQAMVQEVVDAIGKGLFDSEKYKDCYDPYDEL